MPRKEDAPPERTPEQIAFDGLVGTSQTHFWNRGDVWITRSVNYGDGIERIITEPYRLRDAITDAIDDVGLGNNPGELHRVVTNILPNSTKDVSSLRAGGQYRDWPHFHSSTSGQILETHITKGFQDIAEEDSRRSTLRKPGF